MTAISVKEFTGMSPRSPDHLLADNAASYANNCDFSRKVLLPLRGGYKVLDPAGLAVVRSIYTEDGIRWYTWDTELTAYKSPVIGETFDRIYYIENGVLRAALSPKTTNQNGGPPNAAVKWAVGVPNPPTAPKLELQDRVTLADYPTATIEFKTWYTDGAANYGVADAIGTVISPWKRYSLTAGALPAGAPEDAVFVVQATVKESNKQLFQLNTATNTQAPARSQALPGGISMSLEAKDPGFIVNFEWGVVETRAYVTTDVNEWNEESGPSPVSLISPTYLQDVRVTAYHGDFAPPAVGIYRPYQKTNFYRTYGGPQYIKAGEMTQSIFVDSARTVTTAGVALQSLTWVPPVTGMFGLALAPNGWFLAYKDNILYMSEPYRPNTWQYTITFAKAIRGICVGGQSVVVTTAEASYIVTGPHPAAVTSMELAIPVGGISNRSMCKVESGVAYLSNDGIVVVEGSQASLEVSQRYFTRATWRELFGDYLSSMSMGYHDGVVVAVSRDDPVGFLLELDEAGGAMTLYKHKLDALMRLPVLDTLYYTEAGSVYRFREGEPLAAEWNSKEFITPPYTKFGIGFARMRGTGQITVELYADEKLIHTQLLDPLARTQYFRLPSQVGSLKWQFRVTTSGTCSLEDLAFAQSPDELKGV